MVHVRDNSRALSAVKSYAERLGFTVADFKMTSARQGYLLIKPGPLAASLEVTFIRNDEHAPWKWCGAIHRVHWSDPIYKHNGGQPELDSRKAFKAYCALLAVTIAQEVSLP